MAEAVLVTGVCPDLVFRDFEGFQTRNPLTIAFIEETVARHREELAGLTCAFFVYTGDNPDDCVKLARISPVVPAYSVAPHSPSSVVAIPDFIFTGWPEAGIESYDSCTAAIRQAGQAPPVIDKVFWIGNAGMIDARLDLVELGKKHPADMHFVAMDWDKANAPGGREPGAGNFVSLPDHCAYSMLLDIRGIGYSGRLKLLMHANRPVFVVDRPYREFFYDAMRPGEDFMPVKADLSDLAERVAQVKNDPALAQKLAANATAFARKHLTREAAMAYLCGVLLRTSTRAAMEVEPRLTSSSRM